MNYSKPTRFLSIGAMICFSILLVGCGSTSVTSQDTTTINFDIFRMQVSNTFEKETPAKNYNSRLGSRPITLLTRQVGQSQKDNIILTKLPHNPAISSLDAATNVMVENITKTFGGYDQAKLRKHSFECSTAGDIKEYEKYEGYIHSYSLTRGNLDTTTSNYISQYYFVSDTWMYIISGLSHTQESISEYEGFWKSIACQSGG